MAIDRVMYAGVTVLEVGVTIRDLSVADVGPRACPFPECIASPGGHGVVSALDGEPAAEACGLTARSEGASRGGRFVADGP